MIDAYVMELRRRGYNMVRTHTLERLLMLDAQEKGRPDPRFADAVDYCFAQLKKNGIYLNLNIVAYQLLYPYPKQKPQDHKTKLIFGDEQGMAGYGPVSALPYQSSHRPCAQG